MMVQDPQPGVVADVCIQSQTISLGSVWDAMNIEVILVPSHNLTVRHALSPRSNAPLGQLGQRLASEPAIVYDTRYHSPFLKWSLYILMPKMMALIVVVSTLQVNNGQLLMSHP